MEETSPPSSDLKRALTLFPTTALVIGCVVGSGIFVSSASMARELGSAPLLLLVWVVGGTLTFFGALTMCELASLMPRTGGLYEYLKEIYGRPTGFFYGWANFTIAGSGAIAALAFIFANYIGEFTTLPRLPAEWEKMALVIPFLGKLYPFADMGVKALGTLLVVFLTWINVRGVKLGASLQSLSTSSKMIAMLAVVAAAFFCGSRQGFSHFAGRTPASAALSGWTLIGAIGMALSGAFWAYDGWGNVAYIAGEVKDPERTIPRAMVLGTFGFVSLYLLMNLAYLYVLPVGAIGQVPQDRVASTVVSAVLGGIGGKLVAALIILSTFDTTNSSILTNGRVYYAMAEHGLFWKKAGAVHRRYQTPHVALICQGLWSIVLLVTGSFDIITSMYVFVNWLLYVMMAVGLFLLRFRHPTAPRPFRIPGYPWVPGIFTVFATVYVLLTLVTDIQAYQSGAQPVINSLMGLVLVFSGTPLYLYCRGKSAGASSPVSF